MKKHEHFEIWLHDDNELFDIQGMGVTKRESLHSWPLSVVERIVFSDGTRRIYKAFYNLPVETEFYRQASSQHIPRVFFNKSDGDQHWLLLEDVKGQSPNNLDREQLLALAHRARTVINEIGLVEQNRYNLSEEKYSDFVNSTVELLQKLRQEKKLKIADGGIAIRIGEMLSHPEVLQTVRGKCALLHGDLKCDNIIIRPDGEIVIIDWQSILFGPETIDIYYLMANHAMNPVSIAGIGPEILRLALAIRWFSACLDRWLPYLDFFSGQIAKLETQMCHVVKNNGYADMESEYFTK